MTTETANHLDADLTNITNLRDFMLTQIKRAANGELTPAAINSMANLCGKVIATVKIEHDHAKLVGNQPMIGFVGDLEVSPKRLGKSIEGETA